VPATVIQAAAGTAEESPIPVVAWAANDNAAVRAPWVVQGLPTRGRW
jgi:hypothetical protein